MKIFHKEKLIAIVPDNYSHFQMLINGRMLHVGPGYTGWYQPILPEDEIRIE